MTKEYQEEQPGQLEIGGKLDFDKIPEIKEKSIIMPKVELKLNTIDKK